MSVDAVGGEEEVCDIVFVESFLPIIVDLNALNHESRTVLQIRGVCQYGKLNHYLGAKGNRGRQKTMYPDIDFCKNPGAICSDRRAPELRWVTGENT